MKHLVVLLASVLLGFPIVNAQEKVEELTPEQHEAVIKEFLNSYLSVRNIAETDKISERSQAPSPCSSIGTACRGSCPDFYRLCGASDGPVYKCDLFENQIAYYGQYGSDVRQRYYVYRPTSGVIPKNEVVVLIHGGAWFSGPNPDEIRGFPSNYSTSSTQSLVKDLMNNGYTVISVLYRLMKLGSTNAEIISNGNKMTEILDDIEGAVEHFKMKTSTGGCVSWNFTKYHIVGESAGGHIALMYAYTRANPVHVKSVTSLYAPTNMVQFSSWISNHPIAFSCNATFTPLNNPTVIQSCNVLMLHPVVTGKQSPYYWAVDTSNTINTQSYFNTNCRAAGFPNILIYPGNNLIKGLLGKANPTTEELKSISPVYQTNETISTFIMHGTNDFLVPYSNATQGMVDTLSSNGGVKFQNNVCPSTTMPTLLPSEKHLVRVYKGADHGFLIRTNTMFQEDVWNKVRVDILHWINNH